MENGWSPTQRCSRRSSTATSRYVGRRPSIPAFDATLGLVDEVLPVDLDVVEQARRLALSSYRLSARDAIHVAVMRRAGIRRVMTFDAGFDTCPGIERLR